MKWKGIYSHRIFTQLVVFTLLISLIPTLSITFFLFYKLENMVKTELSESYRQMTSQYIKNIDEKLTQYRYSLDVIADNTVILETLVDKTESPYIKGEQISSEVTKSLLLDRQREIRNCMLYSDIDEYPVYGKRASMVKEAGHEEWFLQERAIRENSFSYISSAGNVPVLSFVKNIENVNIHNYEKEQLGFLKLDLYMDLVFKPADTANEGDSSYEVIVYGDDSKILYSSAPQKNYLLDAWLAAGESSEPVDGFTIKHENLEKCALHVLLLFDNHQLTVKQQAVRQMILPIMLCVILLILFWSWLYSRNFSVRIGCLVQKFHKAETGDLNIYGPISGNDEVAELDRQFSHMLGKLDALIQKNYIRELENKEAQLKNLQLQINPHFLYNTLETISSMAAVKQVFDICDICQRLGEIFRYNLGKNYGEFVTVAQELGHVQNYIFIIKKRYGNRFEVFYNISVDTDNAMTLRFILQPIVENAILHGLVKQTTTGTLELSAWEEEDSLMIRVEDDGIGMDIQKVEELNRSINVADDLPHTGLSIGIRNVNQRIKLACGDQYGITIKSTLHYGSQFDLRLPLIRKGEKTDEKEPADSR